jgi:hypothetical protein
LQRELSTEQRAALLAKLMDELHNDGGSGPG